MAAKLGNIRTLIIDDHYFMRSIWKTMLVAMGVNKFIEATNAVEAFEALRSAPCDLVIVDYHLGDLTGAEFAKLLRRSPDSANSFVPIIACTADAKRSIAQKFVDAGVDEFLVKPVSPQSAWSKIHSVIEKRRQFIRTQDYCGPDRRRRANPSYTGPERRKPEEPKDKVEQSA